MTKIQRWFADDLSENYEVKEDGQWVKWDDVKDLIKDAERYRWLRDQNTGHSQLSHVVGGDDFPPYRELKHTSELDAAIDAAMAKDGA